MNWAIVYAVPLIVLMVAFWIYVLWCITVVDRALNSEGGYEYKPRWWNPHRLRDDEMLPDTWLSYGIRDRVSDSNIKEEYYIVIWLPVYKYVLSWRSRKYVKHAWIQSGISWWGVEGVFMLERECKAKV